jgi:hypothetical protein
VLLIVWLYSFNKVITNKEKCMKSAGEIHTHFFLYAAGQFQLIQQNKPEPGSLFYRAYFIENICSLYLPFKRDSHPMRWVVFYFMGNRQVQQAPRNSTCKKPAPVPARLLLVPYKKHHAGKKFPHPVLFAVCKNCCGTGGISLALTILFAHHRKQERADGLHGCKTFHAQWPQRDTFSRQKFQWLLLERYHPGPYRKRLPGNSTRPVGLGPF